MADPLIIDVHMHVFPTKEEGRAAVEAYEGWEFGDESAIPEYSRYSGDVADTLEAMDEANVSRAVMVHFFTPLLDAHDKVDAKYPGGLDEAKRTQAMRDLSPGLADQFKASNREACESVKDHPQILPYIHIDPWVLGPDEAAEHLRDMVQTHGAKGIKLHSVIQRFFMADRRMWPVYQTCADLGLGIIAHSGSAKGKDQYGDPRAFVEVYKAFPTMKLIMAHLGNGSWHQTREVAAACPNAVFDVCEIMEWYGAPLAPTESQLAQLIKDVGPERVMLASDFPWWSTAHCAERIMRMPILSTDEKEGILGANAERILGI